MKQILRQRYTIIQKLGSGGMGETYLAEDLDLPIAPKPKCAVKRVHPTQIHPHILRLFEKEAEILYKLGENHSQIPKLFAYFQEDREFYLIQEFIEGKDLSHSIASGKQWSENETVQLLRELLEVLAYVHQHQVIHRDIKPQNIMRRPDGSLVLIDFGVVKEVSTLQVNAAGFTTRTVAVGTPGYMPSEQAMGKPKLSSDIYAVGVMAIFALTGIPPHQLEEDKSGELVWRDRVRVRVELAEILSKMVRFDYRDRYADAAEALQAIAATFPPLSPTSPSTSSALQLAKNSLTRFLPFGGILVVGVAIFTEFFLGDVRFSPEEPDPTPRAQQWHQQGDEFRQQKQYKRAIAAYEEALKQSPDLAWSWHNRGVAYRELEQHQSALESYEKAIENQGNFFDAWFNKGVSLHQLNRCEEAVSALEKALEIEPGNSEAIAWHTQVKSQCENPENNGITFLENYLAIGNWKAADLQTDTLMEKGFDCETARQIDTLWVERSGGRFGYSVQKEIWESTQGSKPYQRFADTVGWRVNNSWLRQENLNFTIDAPTGHFPWSGWQVSGEYREGFGAFMAKLAACNL
ncbi:protein kinase domain-containing protein [Phormidium sp. CCY1219]|uniref:protein kinase domain-containing protein n=1 Tax=Phormidium sp. CCY1219 TaxID=2886104 RepID=UPI002D1EE997|nr:GUN4 domain-containing protein [Phormidium sp. CCY1219]MEB3830615.1 GUN4 domain-containing protein [Phormidium sp. CCY1219]